MDELTPLIALALVALGLGASSYGVLIGSGGGFIVAPLLIILFGLDHNVAVGTSLFTVALASLSGSVSYLRLRRVDIRSALLFSMAAIPGALLGIFGLKAVAEGPFELIFGAFLTLMGLYVLLQPENPRRESVKAAQVEAGEGLPVPPPAHTFGATTRQIHTADMGTYRYSYNEPLAVATNGFFGFLSGFFGMGGGPIRTPTLVYLFHFPVLVATATSVFAQVIYTSVGTMGHLIDGNVDITRALLIGAGVIVGAQIGVRLSRFFRGAWILRLLSLALLGIGIQLILSGAGAV